MAHDDIHFVSNRLWMLKHIASQNRLGLSGLDLGVIVLVFVELPIGGVGGVVLRHVENEALFDGLSHGVEAVL